MSIQFGGPSTTDCLRIGLAVPSLQNVGAATICCWVNLVDLPDPAINAFYAFVEVSIGPPPGTSGVSRFAFEFQNRAPSGSNVDVGSVIRSLDADGGTEVDSPAGSVSNGLHHFAATVNYLTGDCRFYMDGNFIGSGIADPATFTNGNTSNTLSQVAGIGSADDGGEEFLKGKMEDVRIYTRTLSANEIKTIATCQGIDGIVFGLVNRWELQSGPMNSAASVISQQDSSPKPAQDAVVFSGAPTYQPSIAATFRRRLP